MPHRRRVHKGSFDSHFDDLVRQFPPVESGAEDDPGSRPTKLQEKIDIHARLFALAWDIEDNLQLGFKRKPG